MIDMYHIGGLFIFYSDKLYASHKLIVKSLRRQVANVIIKGVFYKLFKRAMLSGQHEMFCGLDMVIHQVPSKRGYAHDLKFGMKDWEIMLFFKGRKLNTKFSEKLYTKLHSHIVTYKKEKFYSVYEAAY